MSLWNLPNAMKCKYTCTRASLLFIITHLQTRAYIVLSTMAVSCRDAPSVTSDTDLNKLVCLFKDDGEREWLLTDMGACGLNLCWPCLANSAWLAVLGCIGIINQGCLMPANDWLFQHTCFAVWLHSFFPQFPPNLVITNSHPIIWVSLYCTTATDVEG